MTYYDAIDILVRLSSARWTPAEMPKDDDIKNAIRIVAEARVPHGCTRGELHAALWWLTTKSKEVEE